MNHRLEVIDAFLLYFGEDINETKRNEAKKNSQAA